MPRPKKKPDGKIVSVYLSKEVYEEVLKNKEPAISISDYIENALVFYMEQKDILKEFNELMEKYVELEEKCNTKKEQNTDDIYQHFKEGITWEQLMKEMGVNEPKEIVSLLEKYTRYAPNNKKVRIFNYIDDWILVDMNRSNSDIRYVLHKLTQRKS